MRAIQTWRWIGEGPNRHMQSNILRLPDDQQLDAELARLISEWQPWLDGLPKPMFVEVEDLVGQLDELATPHYLVDYESHRHIGPFSTRMDACLAMGLSPHDFAVLSEREFHAWELHVDLAGRRD
jgi:hypothetical protein